MKCGCVLFQAEPLHFFFLGDALPSTRLLGRHTVGSTQQTQCPLILRVASTYNRLSKPGELITFDLHLLMRQRSSNRHERRIFSFFGNKNLARESDGTLTLKAA